ncbi:MAG: ATP-binding protein [Nannocystaceae bacterium]|nr:ATP-binding protein [Nannocystaceae bacterium]
MIAHVHIRGFQALADVTVELGRMTVIVGANASGKSSFLDALALLGRARETSAADVLFGRRGDARHGWMDGARTHGLEGEVQLELQAQGSRTGLTWIRGPDSWTWNTWSGEPGRPLRPAEAPRIGAVRFEPSVLRAPAPLGGDATTIAPNGTGFAATLMHVQLTEPQTWRRIAESLRNVVPVAADLRTHVVNAGDQGPSAALEVRLAGADNGWCPAAHLSEGTLFTLALLTVLYAPARPQTLLLDDIERGLHPRAQRELVACLRGLLAADPDLQIVCTTHSPYLLDEFEPHDVRVFQLDPSGHTCVKTLTEHPDWPRMRGHLSAGEFWANVGESWVFADAAE